MSKPGIEQVKSALETLKEKVTEAATTVAREKDAEIARLKSDASLKQSVIDLGNSIVRDKDKLISEQRELISQAILFITDGCVIAESCGIVTIKEREWLQRAREAVK